jgi:hypothetical protein
MIARAYTHRRVILLLLIIGLVTTGTATPISNSEGSAVFISTQFGRSRGCQLANGLDDSGRGPGLIWPYGNQSVDIAYQNEGLALVRVFGVSPRGFFFDDRRSPNAYATSDVVNESGPDGTIVFGLRLLQGELARDGGIGFSVPAIMAHEFAHLVQFKNGIDLPTVQMELQADFMAGWYLGLRGRFVYTDVRPAFQAFFQIGDYDFNNPGHHGTPQQRLAAIQAGFRSSDLPLRQAFQRGLQFVKSQ